MKIKCPFHAEDTASFHIYADKGYCFGCGKTADLSGLDLESFGVTPSEGRDKVTTPEQAKKLKSEIERIKSLPLKDIRGLKLHCDNGYYYILWTPHNEYYKKRRLSTTGSRYLCPTGISKPIFVASIEDHKTLHIVEGELNALSLKLTFPEMSIVSPGGVQEFTKKSYISLYKQFKNFKIIADDDDVGFKAAMALKMELLRYTTNVGVQLWPIDCNEILQKYGKEGIKQAYMELPTQL